MKRTVLAALMTIIVFTGCTQQQFSSTVGGILNNGSGTPLTDAEVIGGLKEALIKGITVGADKGGSLNGYFLNPKIKIPFPPEAVKMENTLRDIGLGGEVDKFIETLNRGAEDAAKEAKPIFISAIKSMTFEDAWGILKGGDDAATQYLKRTTSDQLTAKFNPIIHNSLEKVSATRYYDDLATRYNKIPFVKPVNEDLDAYATSKAIDGLFLLVAEEESKIRKDPFARTSDLLKKVFAQQ